MTGVSRIMSPMLALFVSLSISPIVRAQSDLERKVEMLFLVRHQPFAETKAKVEELQREGDVSGVLIGMLAKHRDSVEGTLEFIYLNAATAMVGEMKLKGAESALTEMLFDPRVHENVRALAARSLGQIDPESNKQTLLKALDSSAFYRVRVYAARELAKTRDEAALKALEEYSRGERDSYVREEFEKAAQALRAKGVKPN